MNTQIEIEIMQDEIRRLYSILNKNNINIENSISKSYTTFLRTIKSTPSLMRRTCIQCRKNLTLGHFSDIDRRKRAHESVCCNCIKLLK